MVKMHFLQNVLKNGLDSEKNTLFFSINRGGGSRPLYGISIIFSGKKNMEFSIL